MTPSFAQPTQENGNIFAFARDICVGFLSETVVVNPDWLTPVEVNVHQAADMEDLLARLTPGHTRLTIGNIRPDRVSVTQPSLSSLSLVHPMMVSHFLAPETAWHMMHTNDDAMEMTQWVAPFIDWLRAAMVDT